MFTFSTLGRVDIQYMHTTQVVQVSELQSPTSRRPEQKGLPSPPQTVPHPTFEVSRDSASGTGNAGHAQ